jgi:hypothetical protein
MPPCAADIFFTGYFPLLLGNVVVAITCLSIRPSWAIKNLCLAALLITACYLLLTASLFPGCGMAGPVLLAGFATVAVEFVVLLAIYLKRLRAPAPPGQ